MKKRIFTFALLLIFLPGWIFGQSTKEIVIDDNPYISKNSRYPVLERQGVLYFPLTSNNLDFLGLEYEFQSGQLEINKSKKMPIDHLLFYPEDPSKDEVKKFPFLSILKTYPMDPEYPLLEYKDILYFPMTWRNCVEILGWNYEYEDQVLRIDTKKDLYYEKKEDKNIAVEDRVYQLEDFEIFKKEGDRRRLIYRLPKIATNIQLKIVDRELHLMYNMGQSRNSQQRYVIFDKEPREIYSGKYRYFTQKDREYLLQQDIVRSNLFEREGEDWVDFSRSKYVYQTGVNHFDNFTENFAQGEEGIILLASLDGIHFDRIVAFDDQGKPRELIQDRFLRGFTALGNQLLVINDFGIYTVDVKTGERNVLKHTDAIRVFPSKEPIYIHQNRSLFCGEEDMNPLGKVSQVIETKDGEHIYTWIAFRGSGKYSNILLENGNVIYRGTKSIVEPGISQEGIYDYSPRRDQITTIPLKEMKE